MNIKGAIFDLDGTLTDSITTGGIWGLLFILVIPAALLIYGFVRWMHRRKL